MINCGHNPQTFVPGYSYLRYEPTEDFEENERIYKLTQQQRAYERQVRADKTAALSYKAAGDDVAFTETAKKITADNKKYRQFCADNDLTARNDRLQVVRYNREMHNAVQKAKKGA